MNSLKGVVSEIHFANLSRLKSVDFSGNGLISFEMKRSWDPPFQRGWFAAESTKGFGNNFPRWFETQKELSYLKLFNSSISGPVSAWLRGPNLYYLDLSYNQISGSLAKSKFHQMPNLGVLFITDTHINGSLPRSICRLQNLEYLSLSNNRLSGTIPSCLLTLHLNNLDLSSNKFSRVFPTSLQSHSSLNVIRLANNKLQGELPMVLRNCESLSSLDLQGNRFSGNIPTWVGERLGNLNILILRDNMFNGTIPSSLWQMPSLQVLDLAGNKLVGNIPPKLSGFSVKNPISLEDYDIYLCVQLNARCDVFYHREVIKSMGLRYSEGQLNLMTNIDLSSNNLVGVIPSEITTLKDLIDMNLSHNNLSRSIPMMIGRMKSLESLDLSFNQLSGPFPTSLSYLNSLGVLKLSNNNFSGRVPREGFLSTFNDASTYDGNPNLCGDPLTVRCSIEESFELSTQINKYDNDKWENMWFYIIILVGYAFGFWGVVAIFIVKRSWRFPYFQFVDEAKDKIHEAILVNMERLKPKRKQRH